MWSLWVREKGTTQVMYIAKLKDGLKRVKKTFSTILERVFEMVWWRGDGITSKRIFEVEVLFSSQNINFPFYLKRLLEFSPFSLFFSCSVSWGLGDFDDIRGENHFFKNLFSIDLTLNGMVKTMDILAVDAHSRMELCTPTWLNHDYGDGRVVDILALDAYSGVEVCMSIFLGEASKKISVANHCWKNCKTQMDASLNKAQHK
jgi:hypothetical protein